MNNTIYKRTTSYIQIIGAFIIGIFSILQLPNSVLMALYAVILIIGTDLFINILTLVLVKDTNKMESIISSLIDLFFLAAAVYVFISSSSLTQEEIMSNPLLKIFLAWVFIISIIFDMIRTYKFYKTKDILRYLSFIDLIITTLLGVFMVYAFHYLSPESIRLLGVFALGFGTIKWCLVRFIDNINKQNLEETLI